MKPMPIFAVVLAMGMTTAAFAQTEQDVRQAYAKAVFAHQVYLLERGQSLTDNQITFQLSDFTSGEVAGNQNPLSTIFASTSKDALQATLAGYHATASGKLVGDERYLSVDWLSK